LLFSIMQYRFMMDLE